MHSWFYVTVDPAFLLACLLACNWRCPLGHESTLGLVTHCCLSSRIRTCRKARRPQTRGKQVSRSTSLSCCGVRVVDCGVPSRALSIAAHVLGHAAPAGALDDKYQPCTCFCGCFHDPPLRLSGKEALSDVEPLAAGACLKAAPPSLCIPVCRHR